MNNVLYIDGEVKLPGKLTSDNLQHNKTFHEIEMEGKGQTKEVTLISPQAATVDRAVHDMKRTEEIIKQNPGASIETISQLQGGKSSRHRRSKKTSKQNKKKKKKSVKSKQKTKTKKQTKKSSKNKKPPKKNKKKSKKKTNSKKTATKKR